MSTRQLNLWTAAIVTAVATAIAYTGVSLMPVWALCMVGTLLVFGMSFLVRRYYP